ncbi:MAG: FliH/SctL family protein [Gemmatimonadaceae bacterium]
MLSSSPPRTAQGRPGAMAPARWALEELAPTPGSAGTFGESVPESPAIDIDAVAREAYERGFEEGRQAGAHNEAERLRSVLTSLNDALLTLHDEMNHWIGNAQENVCALSIAVARQILAREVQGDSASIDLLVRQALAEFPMDQPVIVRLNPADLSILSALKTGMAASRPAPFAGDRPEVQWLSDARITPGGCVIEGRDRIIDGRIDTALERLYRQLTSTGA